MRGAAHGNGPSVAQNMVGPEQRQRDQDRPGQQRLGREERGCHQGQHRVVLQVVHARARPVQQRCLVMPGQRSPAQFRGDHKEQIQPGRRIAAEQRPGGGPQHGDRLASRTSRPVTAAEGNLTSPGPPAQPHAGSTRAPVAARPCAERPGSVRPNRVQTALLIPAISAGMRGSRSQRSAEQIGGAAWVVQAVYSIDTCGLSGRSA